MPSVTHSSGDTTGSITLWIKPNQTLQHSGVETLKPVPTTTSTRIIISMPTWDMSPGHRNSKVASLCQRHLPIKSMNVSQMRRPLPQNWVMASTMSMLTWPSMATSLNGLIRLWPREES